MKPILCAIALLLTSCATTHYVGKWGIEAIHQGDIDKYITWRKTAYQDSCWVVREGYDFYKIRCK